MSVGVLVADGEQRAALASVRSLGTAGYRVVVASEHGASLAGHCRFASAEVRSGSALSDPEGYRARLLEAVADHDVRVVLPAAEASSLALLGHRDVFPGAIIAGPSLDAFHCVSDKRGVRETATRLGVRVPRQWVVAPGSTSIETDPAAFPLVIKPRSSVVSTADGTVRSRGVAYVADRAELTAELGRFRDVDGELLVQEQVDGNGIGVFLLRRAGRTWAASGHRRIREKPPRGGVSVVRESLVPDPDLQRRCEQLLDACGFEGVAMVELKLDAATGEPVLIEVNGRLWGSVQLAIDAGVDFPRLFVDLWRHGSLTGEPPACRAGVRTRWFWGDVDHHLARLRGVEGADRLGPIAAARQLLSRGSGRPEVWRRSDMRPFVYETRQWVRDLFRGSDTQPTGGDGGRRAPDGAA